MNPPEPLLVRLFPWLGKGLAQGPPQGDGARAALSPPVATPPVQDRVSLSPPAGIPPAWPVSGELPEGEEGLYAEVDLPESPVEEEEGAAHGVLTSPPPAVVAAPVVRPRFSLFLLLRAGFGHQPRPPEPDLPDVVDLRQETRIRTDLGVRLHLRAREAGALRVLMVGLARLASQRADPHAEAWSARTLRAARVFVEGQPREEEPLLRELREWVEMGGSPDAQRLRAALARWMRARGVSPDSVPDPLQAHIAWEAAISSWKGQRFRAHLRGLLLLVVPPGLLYLAIRLAQS